jgi:hypothetical protein
MPKNLAKEYAPKTLASRDCFEFAAHGWALIPTRLPSYLGLARHCAQSWPRLRWHLVHGIATVLLAAGLKMASSNSRLETLRQVRLD